MAAGGGGVQRRPLLGVGGVGVTAVRDQQLHHLLAVVDAALVEGGQAVLVRAVRADAHLEESPDWNGKRTCIVYSKLFAIANGPTRESSCDYKTD